MELDLHDIPVVDTHEHIENMYRWRGEDTGLGHLLLENHYLMAVIAASDPKYAGREWNDPENPVEPLALLRDTGGELSEHEGELVRDYFLERLPPVAHTSDWKSMELALRELHGLRGYHITAKNWDALDRAVRQRYSERAAWHRDIFARGNVKTVFWCYGEPLVEGPFRSVVSLGEFLGRTKGGIEDSDALAGALAEWLDGQRRELDIVSLKIGSVYRRDGLIAKRSRREADDALRSMSAQETLMSNAVVDDFLHDLAADACAERALVVQVHTGYLAGNSFENELRNTYAARMETFFARHPRTRFDVFHGSFPQWGEAVTLARHYPNIFLNTCWVPSTSESMAEAMLDAALDAVPVNKIMWGGDAHSPEMAFGILRLFQRVLKRALEKRAEPTRMRCDAVDWILFRSAAELYGLEMP